MVILGFRVIVSSTGVNYKCPSVYGSYLSQLYKRNLHVRLEGRYREFNHMVYT